ncbi:MAG: alpha-ribazole phosphatase [Clostridia bacterium]|jgi:alpha-ribazole phosphatase|nr:alpha-ribazole phosphatase [Clostridia bacterium]
MKLYLIRHGETVWNVQSRYQGHTDVELSPKGHEQGKLVAKRLAKVKLDEVFASDLSRAYQTAKYIALWHQLEVKKAADLRELNFGVWEGLTFEEITQNYGDLAEKWYDNPIDLTIPEGEMFSQLELRVKLFIAHLLQNYQGKNVAVVSHGGTIRAIICSLLEIEFKKIWLFRQDNTCINIIEFFGKKPILSLLNDTHHLENI